MTLDSSELHSIADGDSCSSGAASITVADAVSDTGIEGVSISRQKEQRLRTSDKSDSWGYLFLHNMTVAIFERMVNDYNSQHVEQPRRYFIHRTYRYFPRKDDHGVRRRLVPTVSGLVFLQGSTLTLRRFLKERFPSFHLVNDCSTRQPAAIEDAVMQPFMRIMSASPERITFLTDPFNKFARDHTLLRVMSGPFKGQTGYIVRIDRDRQLVMNLGGYAVALRGVYDEDFEEVK